ncbi:hypothetical protein GCM10009744_50030 [Kribbella alba]|uniref:Uncharacterized protein n=1 Tax=Kribbella alba TaxID=190197 RepID=A0ABN2FMG9_9ACTN
MLTSPVESTVLRLSLDDCRRPDSLFSDLVRDAALVNGLEPRALTVRTLLHLPRVARFNGTVGRRQIEMELRRSAAGLRTDQARIRSLIPTNKFPLQDLRFVEYDAREAAAIFSHLHYLRSARAGSRNFALVDPVNGLPVSLCSVSPLEWLRVGRQLQTQFGVPRERVWDVSRVYSFDVAPSNAISFLLAKVRNVFRTEVRDVDLLTTAVDPNLGFTGSSYRAANWHRWMSIQARPYLYVDRLYASPRQLRQRFGTANLSELQVRHGAVVEQSRAKLLDSTIFCCRVRGETEFVAPDDQRRLRR